MIPCGNRAEVDGWGGGAGEDCPLGSTSDDRRKSWWDGFRSKLHDNNQRILGPERSLSEVVISPTDDLEIPHRLLAINTHTYKY